jgi:ADP-heptose:LPS heptosyltransferase
MILVLRALKLGDLLVAVPALRAVKQHWPDHRIVLACPGWLAPLVDLAQCVDEVLPTPGLDQPLSRRADRPAVAINMHGTGPHSTRLLDELSPGRRIGHQGHGWRGPEWLDEIHERDRWCRLLWEHGVPADPADLRLRKPAGQSQPAATVIVHPGAAYGSKRWPAERFTKVAAALRADGHRVVVTGSAAEQSLAESVASLSGALLIRTSLPELAALIADAALVISGDTGVAHLAYAFATPSVTLFGPAPANQWGPPDNGPHLVLTHGDIRRGDPFADLPDPALLGVSEPKVLAAARSLLAGPPAVS